MLKLIWWDGFSYYDGKDISNVYWDIVDWDTTTTIVDIKF